MKYFILFIFFNLSLACHKKSPSSDSSPIEKSCPEDRPEELSPCDAEWEKCDYGSSTLCGREYSVFCYQGVWHKDGHVCTADYNPVCGEDGETYSNDCSARCFNNVEVKCSVRKLCLILFLQLCFLGRVSLLKMKEKMDVVFRG